MRTFLCECNNTLFFDSLQCINCGKTTGLCPVCDQVVPLNDLPERGLECGNPECPASIQHCANRQPHQVCNRLVSAKKCNETALCDYCELTSVIPDLSTAGNVEKWKQLERAKSRVLYMLDKIGLEFRNTEDNPNPKLVFQFQADLTHPVSTGHSDGCISINIREADSVERERSRVKFQEPQRTLVGHVRHELGHFFWDRLVKGQLDDSFRNIFGDEQAVSYQDALQLYYQQGPKADWSKSYISGYATMHPWEDFAETFSAYLAMISVVATANHFGVADSDLRNFDATLESYQRVGVIANEFNRDMGLLDLVPQVFMPPVIPKLHFIHRLRKDAQAKMSGVRKSRIQQQSIMSASIQI